jgi:hypothetical protein
MNRNNNINEYNMDKRSIAISDEYLIKMAVELKMDDLMTEAELEAERIEEENRERIDDEGFSDYVEGLRGDIRNRLESDEGMERQKILNPTILKEVRAFAYKGADFYNSEVQCDWDKSIGDYTEVELRRYFTDEALKGLGLFEAAAKAEKDWALMKEEAMKADIRFEAERDRLRYIERFEDKQSVDRKKVLNPSFHTEIINYLYGNGKCPKRMDCWDAPMDVLKDYGIIEEVISEDAIEKIRSSDVYLTLQR